ncbi:MAG: M3 family oligoendopeptidase [Candidatus Omnitrophica bacterium]|nr:M3 family oligoendopeptidase [Candidatus Omnitrophota bacterium]
MVRVKQSHTDFAKGVTWDLSPLYASIDDPKIEADLREAGALAAAFEKKYKPALSPLPGLLADYKKIVTLMTRPGVFSHLFFAEKTDSAERGAFLQRIKERLTEIQSHLLFFEVEWNKLGEETAERLLEDPALAGERHYLLKLRQWAAHTLSEAEEKIMAVKDNTSRHAFSRLFDEVMNSIPFHAEENGRRVKKTEGEVLALFHSPERPVRRMASEALAEGLAPHTRILTYIYNMILADHRAGLKIRRFKHPMDPMNLSNEIDLGSVRRLIESVKNAYPLVSRYYRLKKKLLGLDAFYDYDRYAAVDAGEARVPFEECKSIVLAGYHEFSPEAGRIAELFFKNRWIDAEVREGKQGGGFCCQTTPDLSPYILVNYTGNLRDVMTVAHELGHGLHQVLAGRRVGILESDAPLTMAETASVFGEMIIFEKILSGEKDPRKRLGLLCGKIDDHFATVYRQIALTDFELRAHEAGLARGELSGEAFSDFWIAANREMVGDSVTLTENARHGWKVIPHFIHSPFYCYAYAFAQLFVLSLYRRYKEDKKGFIPKYFEMLSLGGSQKPEAIAAIAGLDIHRADFWEAGIGLLEEFVGQAEELASEKIFQ